MRRLYTLHGHKLRRLIPWKTQFPGTSAGQVFERGTRHLLFGTSSMS